MNRDDVIKFIDGKIFYYSDYINFLYEQLQLRDEIIKEVREYIKSHTNNCMFELRIEEMEELLEILDKENK